MWRCKDGRASSQVKGWGPRAPKGATQKSYHKSRSPAHMPAIPVGPKRPGNTRAASFSRDEPTLDTFMNQKLAWVASYRLGGFAGACSGAGALKRCPARLTLVLLSSRPPPVSAGLRATTWRCCRAARRNNRWAVRGAYPCIPCVRRAPSWQDPRGLSCEVAADQAKISPTSVPGR